ncbi:hypothetical protein BJX70DRAFT_355583 [Aspergillus crustosus]
MSRTGTKVPQTQQPGSSSNSSGRNSRPLANKKRIILCSDGTWSSSDQGTKSDPSNVARLARAIAPRGLTKDNQVIKQIVSYHQGLGSGYLPLPKLLVGGFGWGLAEDVCEIYDFISNNYEPGDELFLFGFSRGAYTVRSVAGLISDVGVLSARHMSQFPELWKEYRARSPTGTFKDSQWWKDHEKDFDYQDVKIEVVGVWDTVGALGIPEWRTVRWLIDSGLPINNKYRFHNTGLSERIGHAFQVLALDEKRAVFPPTLWHKTPNGPPLDLQQCWFPGVHGDIGGTEPGDIGINTFAWMADNLSGLLTFEEEAIVDLITEHNRALTDRNQRWGCGSIVGNFAGPMGIAWRLLGRKDRTPGNYPPDTTKNMPSDATCTNETFHPMVWIRHRTLAGAWAPPSLSEFTPRKRDNDWHWEKDGQPPVPEYQTSRDTTMSIAYRIGSGDLDFKTKQSMSSILCPGEIQQELKDRS